jgi:hypothetical protein
VICVWLLGGSAKEILPMPMGSSGRWLCGRDSGAAGDILLGVGVVLGMVLGVGDVCRCVWFVLILDSLTAFQIC